MQDDVEFGHHHRSSTSLQMIRKYLLLANIDLERGVFALLVFPLADDQTRWLKPAITNCEHFEKDEVVRARIQRLCERLQKCWGGGKTLDRESFDGVMICEAPAEYYSSTESDRCLMSRKKEKWIHIIMQNRTTAWGKTLCLMELRCALPQGKIRFKIQPHSLGSWRHDWDRW